MIVRCVLLPVPGPRRGPRRVPVLRTASTTGILAPRVSAGRSPVSAVGSVARLSLGISWCWAAVRVIWHSRCPDRPANFGIRGCRASPRCLSVFALSSRSRGHDSASALSISPSVGAFGGWRRRRRSGAARLAGDARCRPPAHNDLGVTCRKRAGFSAPLTYVWVSGGGVSPLDLGTPRGGRIGRRRARQARPIHGTSLWPPPPGKAAPRPV